MFNEKTKSPIIKKDGDFSLSKEKIKLPEWQLIEKIHTNGDKVLIVINEVDIKFKSRNSIFQESFMEDELENKESIIIDKKENFKDLSFSKMIDIKKIHIYARGIKDEEFDLLKGLLSNPLLKSITLIEASPEHSKKILSYLPKNLEELRFYDVPLINLPFAQTIKDLKMLKVLDLRPTNYVQIHLWMENKELISTIENLTDKIEVLRLVGGSDRFPKDFSFQAAQTFARKGFSHLKKFRFLNFYFDDKNTKLILDSLPLNLESLEIGSFLSKTKGISSLLLEDFLRKREKGNFLKRLRLYLMIFSHKPEHKIFLPESLEDLTLSSIVGLSDSNFHRIIIPSKLKLKKLSLVDCNINDYSAIKLLTKLDTKVERIDLSYNKITGSVFLFLDKLNKNNPLGIKNIEIENFSVDSNPIDDIGINALSKLPWAINKMNISNIKITDNSMNFLLKNKLWKFTSINIGNNHLSPYSINKIIEKHQNSLVDIKIDNVLGIDAKILSKYIRPQLESLSLAGNNINDSDISHLAIVLPKSLNYFNISGSTISAKGAQIMAKNMPNLTEFYFNFKFGEDEDGLWYILQSLSPYLLEFSNISIPLSFRNATVFSKNMPPYLYRLIVPAFEKEECKILLASLPNALRVIRFGENIKSNGESLKELTNKFPSQTLVIYIGNSISQIERDLFLANLKHNNFYIFPSEYITTFSHQFVRFSSLFHFQGNGIQHTTDFKGVILPEYAAFLSRKLNDVPNGFLNSFTSFQLKNLRQLIFVNCSNFKTKEIIDFINKLPPDILFIAFAGTEVKIDELDTILNLLPKNLRVFHISSKYFGEDGAKKIKEFKQRMEEKSGLPLEI